MTNGQALNVAHESVSSICRARVYSAGQNKIRFSRWLPLRHGEMTRRSQTVSEMGEFQHQVQASILRILFISPLPIHLWICRSTEKVLIWNSRQMWLGHDCQKFRLFYSGGFEGIYYYCIFPILEGLLLPLVQHSFPLSLTSWVMFSELIFRFIHTVFWPLALVCIPILCEGWIAVVILSALCWLRLYVPSVGCQTKLKPEPNQTPRICPHCHNGKPKYPFPFFISLIYWLASVFPTKKNTWFELFFVPIIPLSRKHILLCMICGWQAALINHECVHWYGSYLSLCLPNHSQAPAIASANKPRGVQGWDVPNQTGYKPAYIPCQK